MRKAIFSAVFLLFCIGPGSIVYSQKLAVDNLPQPESPVGCGLALRYIDDALGNAHTANSNLIAIVRKDKRTATAIARKRIESLERYIRFRGFENFIVALGFEENTKVPFSRYNYIDFYVRGERLYSLPIERKDKFDLSQC